MHEPISVLLLLPHTVHCKKKSIFITNTSLKLCVHVLCVERVNKIPVSS